MPVAGPDGKRCAHPKPVAHERSDLLPISEFSRETATVDGLAYYCRDCKKLAQQERDLRRSGLAQKAALRPPVPMDDDEVTEPGAHADGPRERMADGAWASIPDVHDPNHDPYAWAIALEVVLRHRPKLLHIAGDLMDCASLSIHEPTSLGRQRSFDDEVASANRRLDEISQAIPSGCTVVFTEGNHEFRWVRELAKFAHHTALRGSTLQELLNFERRGWLWVPFREHYNVPGSNLRLTHSLEKFGINSVRDHLKDLGDGSVVFGDIHRRELIECGDADGRYRFSACPGWLGDVSRISYMHRTKCLRTWRHGLMAGWIVSGRAYPMTVPIVDRAAVFEGRLIRAA